MFENINTPISLSQKIEEAIVGAIREGKLTPGQKLPTENELCKQFSVSRTAVREAIRKLNARGLITVKKGSGTYVSEISINQARQALNLFFELSTQPNLLLDTVKARRVVEPSVAAFAAQVRTTEHIDLLSKNLEALIACDIEDLEREAELDNEFHSTIIKATNNSVLQLVMRPIYSLIPKYRKVVFAKSDNLAYGEAKEILIGHHRRILNAIIDGDSDVAFKAMSAHLENTEKNFAQL